MSAPPPDVDTHAVERYERIACFIKEIKPRASTSDAVTGAIDVFRRALATAAPLR